MTIIRVVGNLSCAGVQSTRCQLMALQSQPAIRSTSMTTLGLPDQGQPYTSTRMQMVRGCTEYGTKRIHLAMIGGRSSLNSAMYVLLLPLSV